MSSIVCNFESRSQAPTSNVGAFRSSRRWGSRLADAAHRGCCSAGVTKVDDGITDADVWDSPEAFEKFAAEKIGPISQEVGVPGPPQIQFFDVHNYLTSG